MPECKTTCSSDNVRSCINEPCDCEYPWVNRGDFLPLPDKGCYVNFPLSKGLWIGVAALHSLLLVLLLLSLVYLKRGTRQRARIEQFTLLNLCFSVSMMITVSCLQISAQKPGARSVGVDILTTSLYVAGETALTLHAVFLPFLRNGTTIIPIALDSSPFLKNRQRLIHFFYAILFLSILTYHGLILAISFNFENALPLASASFSICFVVALFSGGFSYFVTLNLRTRINTAIANSKELTENQRIGLEAARKRATGTNYIALIVVLLYAPSFLVFAIAPTFLWSFGYIYIPVRKMIVCLFDFRHPYLSLTTSYSHYHGALVADVNDKTMSIDMDPMQYSNLMKSLMSKNDTKGQQALRTRFFWQLLPRVEEEQTAEFTKDEHASSHRD